MIKELQDIIGKNEIEKGLSDLNIDKTILAIISNGKLSVDEIDKKSNKSNENLILLQERLFYSEYISSNKAIVASNKKITTKLVTTANKYALGFNINTFNAKFEAKKDLISSKKDFLSTVINEYMDALESYTEDVSKERAIMLSEISNLTLYLENSEFAKYKFILLIEKSVDLFKSEFEKYFKKRIFDETKVVNDVEYGLLGSFITMNNKKPLLGRVGLENPNLFMYKEDEVLDIYMLKKYADKKFKTINEFYGPKNTSVMVKYNPKDKQILDFKIDSCCDIYNDKLKNEITVINLLSEETIKLDTYSKLMHHINKLCEFSILILNDRNSSKYNLYTKYSKLIKSYDKESESYVLDKDLLKLKLPQLIEDVCQFNIISDNSFNLKKSIDLKLALFNEGRININDMLEELKENFVYLLYGEDFKCFKENKDFMFACGQLARYLITKSKSVKKMNEYTRYKKVISYKKLVEYLELDVMKYGHAISLKSREVKVLKFIKLFALENFNKKLTVEDKMYLELGIYSDNIFYIKKEELIKK